ncbi:rod shape-determining protein MreC [Jejudonia soesokkakensis]|uniref:Cell shape-determining protein MreC n=1 Tax=Jejudonia soesokkakensis TaxID=1323432 RepID=A0ABW2MP25_9FLAO
MRQIIFFFIRNKNFLFFLLLFCIALVLTVRSHSFHKSKFVSSSNYVTGGVYSFTDNISGYFGLKTENEKLLEENLRLRKLLQITLNQKEIDSLEESEVTSQYRYVAAKVINNNYSKTKNNITVKKGSKDSVKLDMGVITSKGIIGVVNSVSKNYATIQSILNTNSSINAKLKKTEHFGFLEWDTKNPNVAQLIQIPRLAPVQIGDTITTGGKSTIFPKGVLIGTVKDYTLKEDDSYLINVALFNDMTNLKNVYIIENTDKVEIQQLEETVAEDDAE